MILTNLLYNLVCYNFPIQLDFFNHIQSLCKRKVFFFFIYLNRLSFLQCIIFDNIINWSSNLCIPFFIDQYILLLFCFACKNQRCSSFKTLMVYILRTSQEVYCKQHMNKFLNSSFVGYFSYNGSTILQYFHIGFVLTIVI